MSSGGIAERTAVRTRREQAPTQTGSWWAQLGVGGRRAFRAAYAGYMLDAFDLIVLTLSLTAIGATFGVGTGATGALSTVTLSASAIGGVLGGVLSDRIGRARTLMLSIAVYSLFTFLSGLASSYGMLMAFRVFQGIGFGAEWGVGAVIVAEFVRPDSRGKALGIIQSAWAAGWALAVVAYLICSSCSTRRRRGACSCAWACCPALLILYVRRRVERPRGLSARRGRKPDDELPLRRIFCRRPAADDRRRLLARDRHPGRLLRDVHLDPDVPQERARPDGRRHQRLPVRGHRRRVPRLPDGGLVHDRLGRGETFALFSASRGRRWSLLPGAAGSNTTLLLVGFPLGFFASGCFSGFGSYLSELYPTQARGHRRRLLLQRRPRHRGAVPGHHRLPRHGDRARRRGRLRRVRYVLAIAALALLPETHGREMRADRVTASPTPCTAPAPTTSSSRATRARRSFAVHEPGVLLRCIAGTSAGRARGPHGASALLVMAEHSGTHIDALCHQAYEGRLHGGLEVTARVQTPTGFTALGIDTWRRWSRAACCSTWRDPAAAGRPRGDRGGPRARRRGRRAAPRRRRARAARLRRAVGRPAGLQGGGRDDRATPRAGSRRAGRSRSAPTTSPGTSRTTHDPELGSLPGHTILIVQRGHPHHRVAVPRGARGATG